MARNSNKKVIVSGHVPPGFYERNYIGPFFTNGAGSVANDLFVNLVNKYSDVVSIIKGTKHLQLFWLISK